MPLPPPHLDDRTFEELVEEAKKLIPIYAPEWTDYNIHDPGITLIELFAWLAEMQLYHLDQLTERNRLKFLKLLGSSPRPATAARVDVTFSLPLDTTESVLVPRGTKVAAQDRETGEDIVFETSRDFHVVPVKRERVLCQFRAEITVLCQSREEITDKTEANTLKEHFYHPFGERAAAGNMLYLGFDQALPAGEEFDLMFYLYEKDLKPRGTHGAEEPEILPSVEVSWEYLKRGEDEGYEWTDLELVLDETLALSCSGRVSLRIPRLDMAESTVPPFEEEKYKCYWIRCRVVKGEYENPPRIDTIRLNTVPATQGVTVKDIPLGVSTGLPNQSFSLPHKPILVGSQAISVLTRARLSEAVAEGATSLHLSSVPGLQTGDILEIADGTLAHIEYQRVSGLALLVQKLCFAHGAGTPVEKVHVEVSVPRQIYKLAADSVEGADYLQLNRVQGLRSGDILRINDPDGVEYVLLNQVPERRNGKDETRAHRANAGNACVPEMIVTLTSTLRRAHTAQTSLERVTMEEGPLAFELSSGVVEGADLLPMEKVPGLQEDDVLRIADCDPQKIEYVSVSGITITVPGLYFAHGATTPINKVSVEESPSPVYNLSGDVAAGSDRLSLNQVSALQKYDVLKIDDLDKIEYAITLNVSDTTVNLTSKLLYGHTAPTPVKKVRVDEIPFSEQDKPWMVWEEVEDLDASGPEDPHYVIDHETGGIRFGDGVHGRIPPKGEVFNIKATKYRFGGGERGNIKAEAITLILDVDGKLKDLEVTNCLPASGGREAEALKEAVIRARKDLIERYRAITSRDYEYVAKATPGLRVKRARAIPYKSAVTVVVVPDSTMDMPKPSQGFLTTVCKHLDKHRLITTEVHVKGPDYVRVSVNVSVKIKRGYESPTVRDRIEKELKRFLHPLKGGPENDGWPFGRSVFKSEIYELIEGIEGVDCVQGLIMENEEYEYDGEKIEIPESGLVYSGTHAIRVIGPEEECRVKGGHRLQ